MTKSLLTSIQPQHLLNILNGDKTYEVRKVVPKWVLDKLDRGETVEAYLYCTKGKPILYRTENYGWQHKERFSYNLVPNISVLWTNENLLNGTIPVKVVIDGYDTYYLERPLNLEVAYRGIKNEHGCEYSKEIKFDLIKRSGLTFTQLFDYGTKRFDGQQSVIITLHISKVEIFDEVMKLGEFYTSDYVYERSNYVPEIGNRIISENGKIFATYDIASLSWVVQPKPLQHPPMNMMSVWVK